MDYQQAQSPGWESNQFQFGLPPTPAFQPQPNWGGHDVFCAHAATADPYLFDHAWKRVRESGGAPVGGIGVGIHEARQFHTRAYSDPNQVNYMSPYEIGHAAAYQAYRTWIHNSSMYEPFSGDIERQREALTGLAVGEASRLLQNSSRSMDRYSHLAAAEAAEAAGHTASYIFYQARNEDYRSRSLFRNGSINDPYAYDNQIMYPYSESRRSRSSHSRHRPVSHHRSYSQLEAAPYMMVPSQLPLSDYLHPHVYPWSYPWQETYAAYPNAQILQTSHPSYSFTGMPMYTSYASNPVIPPMTPYPRSRSSFLYPQQYIQTGTPMTAAGAMVVPPGSVVIRSSRKHGHHKPRSANGDYD